MNEWVIGWTYERMNEWMVGRVNAWMIECALECIMQMPAVLGPRKTVTETETGNSNNNNKENKWKTKED